MFYFSIFTGNISKWNVSKVTTMKDMFKNSQFNSNISKWKLNSEVKLEDLELSDKVLKHMELRKQIGRFADMIDL